MTEPPVAFLTVTDTLEWPSAPPARTCCAAQVAGGPGGRLAPARPCLSQPVLAEGRGTNAGQCTPALQSSAARGAGVCICHPY